MKILEIDIALYCSHCHDETLHRVQYLNGKIHSTECTECHRVIENDMNPMRELYKEVYKRITSKPTRLKKEYNGKMGKFMKEMPKRVISKPFRLIKYVSETREALKKMKSS
jgi:hypothetical protein